MSLVVATEPTSLVAVEDQCLRVETWAESATSIPELRDAGNKLAAISEYLELTSTEGRARVAAAQRRIEVRIGQLLPSEQGRRTDRELPHRDEEVPLSPQQKADFRRMASDPDEVEAQIAASTDDAPASRRKVTEAIKNKNAPATPRRSPLPEQADRAGWEFRRAVERLERIYADDRFAANREQVAASLRVHLAYATEVLPDLLSGLDTSPTED